MSNHWSIAKAPGFVAEDAGLMLASLLAYQVAAIRRGVANQGAYEAVYARVFGNRDPATWVHLPPATIARGITTIVREVGLFVLQDDDVALDTLREEMTWQPALPAVPVARLVGDTPVYTPTRRRQADNRTAFAALVHRAALLAYAERLSSVRIGTLGRARLFHATVSLRFGAVIDEASRRNDGTAVTLRRIAATAWQLIDERAGPVRDEGSLRLTGNMPSLVVAHLAYREARQAPRIRGNNPTAHPAFMPAELVISPWP